MLAIREEHGIFADEAVAAYASSNFGHTDFGKLKKGQLIEVFLKSGVDLTGRVPAEILAD